MTLSSQLTSTASLLEATSAVTNWRALLLFGTTTLASALIFGLLAITGSPALTILGWLAAWLVLFYGFNAVGIMLMDACRMGVAATPRDAVRRSLATSHRVLGVALTALAGFLLLVAAVAVLLAICRIPLLGPVLFAAVLPLSVLLLGAAALALLYVYVPLTACAIWTGAGVLQAVGNLLDVVRRRLVPVILQEFVLTLIVAVASFVIGAVLVMGASITTGLSAGILGPALPASPMGLMMGFAGGGHMLAAVVGGFVLLALATIVPGLILIQGFCQIYLGATDSLVSELPGGAGDETLNTAARLRAADEVAQHQREQAPAEEPAPPPSAEPPETPGAGDPAARREPTLDDTPAGTTSTAADGDAPSASAPPAATPADPQAPGFGADDGTQRPAGPRKDDT